MTHSISSVSPSVSACINVPISKEADDLLVFWRSMRERYPDDLPEFLTSDALQNYLEQKNSKQILQSIERLSLIKQNIPSISVEILKCLKNLKSLNLSGNQITHLPGELWNLKTLETLDMSKNPLKTLSLSKNSHPIPLKTLTLRETSIFSLPENFTYFANLEELSLTGNPLSSFPEVVLKLPQLQELYLDKTRLTFLPEKLWDTTNLKSLVVDDNYLTILSEKISNLKRLEFLSLNGNHFHSLPSEEIGKLRKLEALSLSKQQLTLVSQETIKKLEANNTLLLVNNKPY